MKKWQTTLKKSNDIIEQLLINRQIKEEDWASFLNPNYSDLHDPQLLKNMPKAVLRLANAYRNKEIIGIFGDYDADGIPGAVLIYQYLRKIGLKAIVFIPTREQGYGLNNDGIKYLKDGGATLLIAIDLGVRNTKEVEYAKSMGLDVIILDHHEMADSVPDCIVVNPKQKGDKYPFKELSASGVVFKFIQAVNTELKIINKNDLKWSLDLVAISTICDCVPLISENRVFAKFGMIVLQKTKRIGLRALYKISEIDSENINPYTVGFQIGPRINAPGRLANANPSFRLLVTNDVHEAEKLAKQLNSTNQKRQKELERVLIETKNAIIKNQLTNNKIMLVYGENWPQGLVGLVAGKLMEEYTRPVIVFDKQGAKLRGSARSIDAYDIVDALDKAKDYLLKYGGHKKAAGLSLRLSDFDNLYDRLLTIANEKIKDEDLIPVIKIDKELLIDEIKLNLLDKLMKLEPFGIGNPRPVFLLKNVHLSNMKLVGKKMEHLSLSINNIKAIAFGMGRIYKNYINKSTRADIVFTLDEDNWRERRVQLKIIDIRLLNDH